MSTYSPLPHIIGSEEYNHDNSCGLAGNTDFFFFLSSEKVSLFLWTNSFEFIYLFKQMMHKL
jgi:hypothetical protein